jgi:hypothetical protein
MTKDHSLLAHLELGWKLINLNIFKQSAHCTESQYQRPQVLIGFGILKQTYSCLHKSAICVQRLDDSQIHANRITFRTLLRSSSLQEPRDPLLKVVYYLITHTLSTLHTYIFSLHLATQAELIYYGALRHRSTGFVNDPSAGSPTETLLQLLLPLNDQV